MKNFGALKFLSGLYVVIGVLVILLAIVAVVYTAVNAEGATVPIVIVAYAIGASLFGITLIGYGEFISLMLKIEENTRLR